MHASRLRASVSTSTLRIPRSLRGCSMHRPSRKQHETQDGSGFDVPAAYAVVMTQNGLHGPYVLTHLEGGQRTSCIPHVKPRTERHARTLPHPTPRWHICQRQMRLTGTLALLVPPLTSLPSPLPLPFMSAFSRCVVRPPSYLSPSDRCTDALHWAGRRRCGTA